MSLKSFNSVNGYSVGANADIDVVDSNGNVTATNLQVTNESNLGNIANITITGGSNNQVITTDGAGNLSFSNQTPLLNVALSNASNVLSNNISNVTTLSFDSESGFDVTDQGNGVARVAMNSTFKYWEVDGQPGLTATGLDTVNFLTGNGISITANSSNTPQSIEFKVDAAGNSGELQFNSNGNLSASNNITWSSNSNVLELEGSIDLYGDLWLEDGSSIRSGGTLTIEPNLIFGGSNLTLANNTTVTANGILTVNSDVKFSKNSNLGNVGNVKITGGTSGYYLQTDGSGNLTWVIGGGSGNGETGGSNTTVQFNDGGNFGGTTAFTFNKSSNTVTINGSLTVSNGAANLGTVGNLVILGGADGQFLKTNGSGDLEWAQPTFANINRPSILFTAASNGTNQTFTDANLTVFNNNNAYAQLYFNGVLMNTSEYSLSGNVLTVSRYLATSDQVVVGPIVQSVPVPGSNTQIVFNNAGNFDTSAGFTYDTAANLLTVDGNIQATNFIGSVSNGNSNIKIVGNANINFSVNGQANLVSLSTSGLVTTGNVSANVFLGDGQQISNVTTKANTDYNIVKQTSISLDNISLRVASNGVPQISAVTSNISTFWSVISTISASNISSSTNTGSTANVGVWSDLSTTSLSSGGDTITAIIQDQTGGHVYRGTFVQTSGPGNASVMIEKLM